MRFIIDIRLSVEHLAWVQITVEEKAKQQMKMNKYLFFFDKFPLYLTFILSRTYINSKISFSFKIIKYSLALHKMS